MGISSNYAKPLAAAGLALAVGACSWFGGEAPPRRAGAETKEPNLASVPAKPTPILTAEQRKALTQDLVRDRENARYTDQQFRIGNVPEAAPPRPAPPRPAAAARPAPPSGATPVAPAAVMPAPADPIPPAAEPAEKEDSGGSSWWWPFGSSAKEKAPPPAAPAATGPTVTATPENMRADPGTMPVTGKPLPQPEQSSDLPAPLAMAPVPPTPRPGTGVALGAGQAASPPPRSALPPPPPTSPSSTQATPGLPRAPDAATIPVPPSLSTTPSDSGRMTPDALGAAPPPPPAMAAVPSEPPPRVAAGSAAGTSTLVAQIEFPESGTALPDAGKRALAEVEQRHREQGGRVRVVAITPRGGAAVAGEAMLAAAAAATERGNAVMRELVRLGVPEGDISVRTAPAAAGRDLRRVDTYLEN